MLSSRPTRLADCITSPLSTRARELITPFNLTGLGPLCQQDPAAELQAKIDCQSLKLHTQQSLKSATGRPGCTGSAELKSCPVLSSSELVNQVQFVNLHTEPRRHEAGLEPGPIEVMTRAGF
ncbi:unnamed protein product [Protopolystoma xenopodis]|uniref:Uncharacterized protein n=1 Tax=Protopolystoma xenopodis TaxID=117903 RepID=A0A448WJW8_9PLAT|nr:unnamed protein product [Protopolystoma xenopodis]